MSDAFSSFAILCNFDVKSNIWQTEPAKRTASKSDIDGKMKGTLSEI